MLINFFFLYFIYNNNEERGNIRGYTSKCQERTLLKQQAIAKRMPCFFRGTTVTFNLRQLRAFLPIRFVLKFTRGAGENNEVHKVTAHLQVYFCILPLFLYSCFFGFTSVDCLLFVGSILKLNISKFNGLKNNS